MILLTSTSDLVEVVTASTQAIQVQASYVDLNGPNVTPGRTNTLISTATTTTVVGSPAASTQRTLKYLSIFNAGTLAEQVTVKHTDGTNVVSLASLNLGVGFTLCYNEGSGWTTYDATGAIQQSIGPGRFLKETVILNGTTSFTTTSATNTIRARLQAAGGSGGGNPATAGSAGSGGSSGGYAEWVTTVSPSTAYTCAVGAGVAGTSAANGSTGGNTSLTVGATTCTANGGLGGVVGTTAILNKAGANSPAVSTNGTLNCGGNPGGPSVACTVADGGGNGGNGGTSIVGGAGGLGAVVTGAGGAATIGFGGGGGGSYASAATAEAGGASANGVLVIDEYS